MRRNIAWAWMAVFFLTVRSGVLCAADRPQWGQRYSRNMVCGEKGLPETFEPGQRNSKTGGIDLPEGSGVKWVARLGSQTCGTPVVAGGKVFVGTNNDHGRDPRIQIDAGVLRCFDEKTGEFLWQLVVPKLLKIKWSDWRYIGLTSSPTVERDRVYLVSNRCEVMCLDAEGMADGNDGPYTDEGRHMAPPGQDPLEPGKKDGDIIWLYDMVERLGVQPHNASNCSVLVHGDYLYVCTSNGVDWTHMKVLSPDAPSVIVLEKNTGKLVARDNFGIGPDITHGQWSSPSLGKVNGRTHLYFGAGNGYLYAFEPVDSKQVGDEPILLENVWKVNGHPLAQTQDHVPADHQHDSTSYEVTAMPVFFKDRVYVTFTQEPFHQMKEGWLTCLDATKTGDLTRTGIVWSYDQIGSSVSTVSIADGLVYAAGFFGGLHCLDAETGECYWVHTAGGPIWGSPLLADGKVYLGTGRHFLWVLGAGKELKVLGKIRMRDQVLTTPVAANGVLYVATSKHLYAVGK